MSYCPHHSRGHGADVHFLSRLELKLSQKGGRRVQPPARQLTASPAPSDFRVRRRPRSPPRFRKRVPSSGPCARTVRAPPQNRAGPAPSGEPAVEETSRGPGLSLRAYLPQRQPQSYFRFPRPSTPAQVRKDGRWAPGAAPRRGCRARTVPGPRRGCDRVRRCSGAQPRPGSPRPDAANAALLRGSAPRFDPGAVSGSDTRAPDTRAPEAAPGAARLPPPALLTLGGARPCRPLSPPLPTPRGGERERELAVRGRVRTTILELRRRKDSPDFQLVLREPVKRCP